MKLLFYKGTKKENPRATLWDNFICSITRSRFSHVELSVYNIDNDHMCWTSSTRDKGVRYGRINTSNGHWVEVPLNVITQDVTWFNQHLGKSYDYIGLIGTVIKLPIFSSKYKWFCSEIIAEFLCLKHPWSYTPELLYRKCA